MYISAKPQRYNMEWRTKQHLAVGDVFTSNLTINIFQNMCKLKYSLFW